jgi:trimethylamine:corrinoid methyltransferase-like protein
VRETKQVEDIPTLDLARELLAGQHMLTAAHTIAHWPQELYLPGSVIDRDNRDNWTKARSPLLEKRAYDEVERRLAAYEPPQTDTRVDAAMRRLIQTGMQEAGPLPVIPPPAEKPVQDAASAQRFRRPRPRRS